MRSRNGNAPVARGVGKAAQQTAGTAKATGGRPELQGNRTGRNACQPAPQWDRPPGADAADELHRALASWTALLGKEPVDPRGRK